MTYTICLIRQCWASRGALEPGTDNPATHHEPEMRWLPKQPSLPPDPSIEWVQQRVKTASFDASLWQDEHSLAVQSFLSDSPPADSLFVAVDNDTNKSSQGSPPSPSAGINDVTYFVRQPKENEKGCRIAIITENIASFVEFGTLALHQTAASVISIIEKDYFPQIDSAEWDETTRRELLSIYHQFMASLTESASQEAGETKLYFPPSTTEHQLDTLAVHWTRQIKNGLSKSSFPQGVDDDGPMEEIVYWRSRHANLATLSDQVRGEGMQCAISILQNSNSHHVESLLLLTEQLHAASEEAKMNLKYLDILKEPCENMRKAKLEDLSTLLPQLLNSVRVICSLSNSYYNTSERVTELLRKVSNEVVRCCRDSLSLHAVLNGQVETVVNSLQHSIHCIRQWKHIYKKTAIAVNKRIEDDAEGTGMTMTKWIFDESSIFSRMDAFAQRCRDLKDICDARVQFLQSEPCSSCSTGNSKQLDSVISFFDDETQRTLRRISNAFISQADILAKLDYNFLDIRVSKWHDDFHSYKNAIKALDELYSAAVCKAFHPIQQVDDAVQLLKVFSNLAHRDAIRRSVEQAAFGVRAKFMSELELLRREFDMNRNDPPCSVNSPEHAGTALWARMLIASVNRLVELGKESPMYLFDDDDDAVKVVADALASSLRTYQMDHYRQWLENVAIFEDEVLDSCLNQSLLAKKDPPQSQSRILFKPLECNFDADLLTLLSEAQHWEHFHVDEGFEVPSSILGLCHRREPLRIARELVLSVVAFYNELLSLLSDSETKLFSSHLHNLDKKIAPGLNRLRWSARVPMIEKYVRTCLSSIQEVYHRVKSFHASSNVITNHCTEISSILLVDIDNNVTYKEDLFARNQGVHRNKCKARIQSIHKDVMVEANKMFRLFQDGPVDVQNEWKIFLEGIDELILGALSKSVHTSLRTLADAINDNDSYTFAGMAEDSEDKDLHPLFHMKVFLNENNMVEYLPSPNGVTDTISTVTKEIIIGAVKAIPRVQDAAFDATKCKNGEDCQQAPHNYHYYYDAIVADESTTQIVEKIMDCASSAASDARTYVVSQLDEPHKD